MQFARNGQKFHSKPAPTTLLLFQTPVHLHPAFAVSPLSHTHPHPPTHTQQVGPKLKSVDEMRKEWSEFKAQQERQRQEAMSNHRGYYLARIDATRQVAGDWSSLPVIRMMIIQNSLDLPFGEKDAAHVQAQVCGGTGAAGGVRCADNEARGGKGRQVGE